MTGALSDTRPWAVRILIPYKQAITHQTQAAHHISSRIPVFGAPPHASANASKACPRTTP